MFICHSGRIQKYRLVKTTRKRENDDKINGGRGEKTATNAK